MFKLTVCLLTFNSSRLLSDVLTPLMKIADEIIIADSGSTDETINISRRFGIEPVYKKFQTHGQQMNYAITLASHDWVFCMDSDEILDDKTVSYLLALKSGESPEAGKSWRISRYWFVLGEQVRTIYPVSSPDFPVRLFNRQLAKFNDRPVDDQVTGYSHSSVIPGFVRHDTFYNLHEVFNKLNSCTTRLVANKDITPSLTRGIFSAIGAFFKWYLFSGAWRTGRVGVVTGIYATLYSFLKYFKAWYKKGQEHKKARKESSATTSSARVSRQD